MSVGHGLVRCGGWAELRKPHRKSYDLLELRSMGLAGLGPSYGSTDLRILSRIQSGNAVKITWSPPARSPPGSPRSEATTDRLPAADSHSPQASQQAVQQVDDA